MAETTTSETPMPDYPRGITFEQVWAMFQETDKKFQENAEQMKKSREDFDQELQESREKFDQELQKSREEFDRRLQETVLMFKETDKKFQETDKKFKETDRKIQENAEQQKLTDEQMKRTDKKMEKTLEQMGGLHNSFGELAEHLVAPSIVERFNEMGFHFDAAYTRGLELFDKKGKIKAEIDILLENSTTIIAVEVKSSPKIGRASCRERV